MDRRNRIGGVDRPELRRGFKPRSCMFHDIRLSRHAKHIDRHHMISIASTFCTLLIPSTPSRISHGFICHQISNHRPHIQRTRCVTTNEVDFVTPALVSCQFQERQAHRVRSCVLNQTNEGRSAQCLLVCGYPRACWSQATRTVGLGLYPM